MHILPIFRMTAQEWCQNDNFIFTSCNFSYWENFMLRFRMTYVHHSTWSGPVLFQATRCTVSHSHWVVGCHLTFDIFSGNLKKEKECKTDFLLEREKHLLLWREENYILSISGKVTFVYLSSSSSTDSWVWANISRSFQNFFNTKENYYLLLN